MAEYFFSAKTNNFYPEVLKSDYIANSNWPDDVIAVSEPIFLEYTSKPPEGKQRGNMKGQPTWIDIPPPTHEELVKAADLEKISLLTNAKAAISLWQTELQLGMISDEDKASLITWLAYIKALQAVDTEAAPDISWPDRPAVPAI